MVHNINSAQIYAAVWSEITGPYLYLALATDKGLQINLYILCLICRYDKKLQLKYAIDDNQRRASKVCWSDWDVYGTSQLLVGYTDGSVKMWLVSKKNGNDIELSASKQLQSPDGRLISSISFRKNTKNHHSMIAMSKGNTVIIYCPENGFTLSFTLPIITSVSSEFSS